MTNEQKRILERLLWRVADVLRGKMHADEYKNYILVFIFYKYLSEIKENEFNLNIPRYVDTFKEDEIIDIEKVAENLKKLNKDENRKLLNLVKKDLTRNFMYEEKFLLPKAEKFYEIR